MAEQVFTTFEEIDQKLRILKLQREIDKEQLKFNFKSAKSNLDPLKFLGGLSGLTQKLIISFLTKKILRKFS